MSDNSGGDSGIGFAGLLTIVFIVLKLTGFIEWSWIWVLAPMWIGLVGVVVTVLFVLFYASYKETR